MKRPLKDVRPIGPISEIRDPESSGIKIEKGPIWVRVEATSFTGNRSDSPEVTRSHVNTMDRVVSDVMTSDDVKERLEFVGEIRDIDIFTDSYTDITVTSFIRIPEDLVPVRYLDEVIDVLKLRVDEIEDLTMRNFDVVSREFVEQQDPAIVR